MVFASIAAPQAWAQERRVEVCGTGGWTLSDGVSGTAATALGTFDAVDPKDAFSWGARVGLFVAPSVEVGFLFNQQATELEFRGSSATVEAGDMTTRTYHGFLAYNFGSAEATITPYLLVGLGATQYGGFSAHVVDAPGAAPPDITGNTKFSMTSGAGVKVGGPRVRYLVEMRFTPTFIRSETDGWWCDPYWGCYVVEEPQYAIQFEMAGGVAFRF